MPGSVEHPASVWPQSEVECELSDLAGPERLDLVLR